MTTDNTNGFKGYKKTQSRKWKLVLLVLIMATVSMFLPPLISAWLLKTAVPLVLISGTEWVSVVTLVVSAYFGMNVWQKKVEKKAENDLEKIKGELFIKANEDGEA